MRRRIELGRAIWVWILASLVSSFAATGLTGVASAGVFTVPETMLLDTTNFQKGWGPAGVARADATGPSVDFTFTGLTGIGTGVKDDYPVSLVYGQTGGPDQGDFSNFTGYTIVVENLDAAPIHIQNFLNTGYTGASGNPANDWTNDTYWCGDWTYVGPGQRVLLYVDFGNAKAWNINDNKVPHTGGGLGWANGVFYSINSQDRKEVSAVGFEVADFSGTNPNATIRVTPVKATTLSPSVVFVDDAWAGLPFGTEVYFPGDPTLRYVGIDAFATVQAGVGGVTSGGAVMVAAGTYSGTVTISAGVTITGDPGSHSVAGPGPSAPVMDGTGSSGMPAFSVSGGAAGVTIEGFEIKNYGPSGNTGACGVSTWSVSTSDVTVRDNYFHDLGYAAVLTGNGWGGAQGVHDDWQVVYNAVQTTGAYAFDMENVKNSAVSHNVISAIPYYVINVMALATETGAAVTTENVQVEYNTITGCADRNINLFAWATGGTDRTATVKNVTVAGNTISGVFNLICAWKTGEGTGAVQDISIDNNTMTVGNPFAANFAVDLTDVGGSSSFSGNTLALSGTIGGGGTYFHGLNIGGAGTGTWDISGNTLAGGGVGSASVGVRIRGTLPSTAVIDLGNNLISGWDTGIRSDAMAAGASVSASWNGIYGNTTYGVLNGAGAAVDAVSNWWGSASGPYHATLNPAGTGNDVSDNVLFDPWIGKAGGENIVCDPDPQYLSKSAATKDVDVEYLGGGSGLVYGYSVSFAWDPSKVTMNSVSQGNLLSDQGSTQFFTNVGSGTCRVDCVLLGAYPGVTGPGTMFTVNFTGIASGVSPVDISVIKVRDKANSFLSGFYEDDGQLVVDIVNPVVSGVFIENVTLPHTDDYIKDGQTAKVTATVTDDDPGFGIGNIRADLTGLGGGASVAPDTYVGGVATWQTMLTSVTCNPSDGTVMVTVTATDPLGNVGTGSDTIIADNTAPVAIANLAAAQQKSGNDGDGTTKIVLTFTVTDPGDAYAVEVYRAGFGSYPEYDDAGGAEPAAPTYGSLPPWTLTGVTASGQKDEPTARDYWYYVAFVKDIAWNVSVVSNKTTGTLNYHLGDVAPGGTGDNYVTTNDISLLGGTYWLSHGAGGYLNYCDVGPTTDSSTNTRPTTDNIVDFEDLMMFAMNFHTVTLLASTPVPFETPQLSLVVDEVSGDVLRAHLQLSGNRQSVKGLRGAVAYDPATLELVGVSRGGLVTSQATEVFFEEMASGGTAQIDAAVMGTGLTVRGSGEVAVLEFRVTSTEATLPVLAAADLRDRNNKALRLDAGPGQMGDRVSASVKALSFGAYPNPFRGETEIELNVPATGEVTLKVYDVSGRQVAVLVDGVLDAGSHRIAWDGRGASGSKVAPGVYLAVVRMSSKEMTGKLFMLP